jgi:hypothetical protein
MFVEFDYLPHYLCREVDEYFRYVPTYCYYYYKEEKYCHARQGYATDWNMSEMTRLHLDRFFDRRTFNENINQWDVSNVECMRNAFYKFSVFNQPLDKWDVSKVYSMQSIFYGCIQWRQSLDTWDTKNVEPEAFATYFGLCD